jgi:hypothetical protein
MDEASNLSFTDVYKHKSDASFEFLVVGRARLLPTPVNLERCFGGRAQKGDSVTSCWRCGEGSTPRWLIDSVDVRRTQLK